MPNMIEKWFVWLTINFFGCAIGVNICIQSHKHIHKSVMWISHDTCFSWLFSQGMKEIYGPRKVIRIGLVNILVSTSLFSHAFFSVDWGPLDSQDVPLQSFYCDPLVVLPFHLSIPGPSARSQAKSPLMEFLFKFIANYHQLLIMKSGYMRGKMSANT